MTTAWLLSLYCLAILLVSLAGGLVPLMLKITHRWMEFMLSFVAGVMLGVGILHLLPDALIERPPTLGIGTVMLCLLAGIMLMFLVERFSCYHHHDLPDAELSVAAAEAADGVERGGRDDIPPRPESPAAAAGAGGHADVHRHAHDVTWTGATLGLTLHSVLAGIALAASVAADAAHRGSPPALAGFGTFLVVFLHKPFDSMTVTTLLTRSGTSASWGHLINGLFALAVPLGVLLFHVGIVAGDLHQSATISVALAFSAGMFLCIAMSDLLPELQFHQHDRVKLTAALIAGLAVAYLSGLGHSHEPGDHEHPGEAAHGTARAEISIVRPLVRRASKPAGPCRGGRT